MTLFKHALTSYPAILDFGFSFVASAEGGDGEYNSVPLGEPRPDRYIYVVISAFGGFLAEVDEGVEIAGVAATELVSNSNIEFSSGANTLTTIWAAHVPNGSTGNIDVDFEIIGAAIAVYRGVGLNDPLVLVDSVTGTGETALADPEQRTLTASSLGKYGIMQAAWFHNGASGTIVDDVVHTLDYSVDIGTDEWFHSASAAGEFNGPVTIDWSPADLSPDGWHFIGAMIQ